MIIDRMHTLIARGFSLTLYRFGLNFDSFRYLTKLPLSTLKIEPNYFLEMMQEGEKGQAMLQTILQYGKILGFNITLGDVKNTAEFAQLRTLSLDGVGGPFLSPIVPAADFWQQPRPAAFLAAGADGKASPAAGTIV